MGEKNYKVIFLCMAAVILFCGIWQANFSAITAMNTMEDGVPVPVPMYHHVLKEGNKYLGAYAITPAELEKDLMWIRDNGYTTVLPSELESYVNNEGALPAKPILLSFDDGYESFYVYAYPLLKQYDMKAVVSIIGYYTDIFTNSAIKDISYSHLTWAQLKEIQESGLVEVGNHTYNLHKNDGTRKGSSKVWGESDEVYSEILMEDIMTLQKKIIKHLEVTPTVFAYPFGYVGKGEPQIISELGFTMTLSCEEGVSKIKAGESDSLLLLKRYNRAHNISTEKYYKKATGQ